MLPIRTRVHNCLWLLLILLYEVLLFPFFFNQKAVSCRKMLALPAKRCIAAICKLRGQVMREDSVGVQKLAVTDEAAVLHQAVMKATGNWAVKAGWQEHDPKQGLCNTALR